MTWGADLRLRHEYVMNPNLTREGERNEMNYFRFRARVWTTLSPIEQVDFNARLTWEPRYWFKPEEEYNVYGYKGRTQQMEDFELDEFIPDTFNVKIKPADMPLTMTIGRQDFMVGPRFEFGDGWLIGDGTPRDGSRTHYFDAARLTFDWKDAKTVVNAIYIDQSAEEDAWLPPINEQDFRHYVSEQDERGVILYVSNKSVEKTQLDGFFIYSHRNAELAGGTDGDIFAFGARAEVKPTDKWTISGQFAPEFGELNDQDVLAFGAIANAKYSFQDSLNNSLQVGVEYLSGDDDGDDDDSNAFDPLWGRWPQWSEFLVFNTTEYGKPAYWSNLIRPNVNWSMKPFKKVDWVNDYSALFAAESYEDREGFDSGSFKGHLFRSMVRYTHNSHLMVRFMMDYFIPGDFYDEDVYDNDGMFTRAEIYLTF